MNYRIVKWFGVFVVQVNSYPDEGYDLYDHYWSPVVDPLTKQIPTFHSKKEAKKWLDYYMNPEVVYE